MKTYEITLTQSRVTVVTCKTEREAVEAAQAAWEGEASEWEPDVTDVEVREATTEEVMFAEVGLIGGVAAS